MRLRHLKVALALIAFATACAPAIRPSIPGLPGRDLMAEFWNAPGDADGRDLLNGPDGAGGAPSPQAAYTLIAENNRGFSQKFDVRDPSGVKWSVKVGDEARPEVVSSRIVWAMGYHQPPNYFLPVWTLVDQQGNRRDMPAARFLATRDRMEKKGVWAWHHNPFVGTQPFRGLIVLMMVLNSTDLKDQNNALYELPQSREHARRWYVVKDLGATLGETGRRSPKRGDVEAFEREGFIGGVKGDRVLFDFWGRHRELLRVVRAEDVVWMCTQLDRMSPAAWRDAFRAGGYDDEHTDRFVRKLREKIARGKALDARGDR